MKKLLNMNVKTPAFLSQYLRSKLMENSWVRWVYVQVGTEPDKSFFFVFAFVNFTYGQVRMVIEW